MTASADVFGTLWGGGTAWSPDLGPTIAIAVTAIVYAAGVRASWRRAGRGRGIQTWQAWSFAGGVATLAVALVSPLDELAEHLFAAHMAQHVLLAVVAPPLLVLGNPAAAVVWALPATRRRGIVQWVRELPAVAPAWRALTAPSVAWAVHGAVLWSWHVPTLYTAALEHAPLHALEHASFVGTAMLLWWGIVWPRRSRRAAYGVGIVVLFVTMLHTGALGALLTFSRRVWYPAQTAGSAFALTPLEDQQLAGLIMWVPGGLLYLIATSAVFLAWMQDEVPPRRARAPRRRLPVVAAPAAELSAWREALVLLIPLVALGLAAAERGGSGDTTQRGRERAALPACCVPHPRQFAPVALRR